MDRLVTFVVMGREIQATVRNAASDDAARAEILDQISKTFHVRGITTIKPRKRTNLFTTYADGFRCFMQKPAPIQ